MATLDIAQLRNVSSNVIKRAENQYSSVSNPLGSIDEGDSFTNLFNKAVDNINTTNAYLSDSENEQVRWALGETDNTHDLSIALQKAQTALQYTVAVRDKALAAYREIINMQI